MKKSIILAAIFSATLLSASAQTETPEKMQGEKRMDPFNGRSTSRSKLLKGKHLAEEIRKSRVFWNDPHYNPPQRLAENLRLEHEAETVEQPAPERLPEIHSHQTQLLQHLPHPLRLLESLNQDRDILQTKKATAAAREKLDSIVDTEKEPNVSAWKKQQKSEFQYNADGRLTRETFLGHDPNTNGWTNQYRGDFSYNAAGDFTQRSFHIWDVASQQWTLDYEEGFAPDAVGRETDYYFLNTDFGWRYTYQYDGAGRVTENRTYVRDSANTAWVNYGKTSFTFSATSKTSVYEYWDGNAWQKNSRNIELNDAAGNPQTYSYQSWLLPSGPWKDGSKYEFSHNAAGQLTDYTHFNWDVNDNGWAFQDLYEFEYDIQGNTTKSTVSYWNRADSSWWPNYKDEYGYDANGNTTQHTRFWWDVNTLSWSIQAMTQTTYDASNRLTSETEFHWDFANAKWQEWEKIQLVYGTNGTIEENNVYHWDFVKNQWNGMYSNTSAHDAAGNLTDQTERSWDTASGQWVDVLRVQSKFDAAAFRQDVFAPDYVDGIHKKLSVNTSYLNPAHLWEAQGASVYYYSAQSSVGLEEATENLANVSVYPNPARDVLHFEWDNEAETAQLELFDRGGRKVFSAEISTYENRLLVGELARGLYIYQLKQGAEIASGKVILE